MKRPRPVSFLAMTLTWIGCGGGGNESSDAGGASDAADTAMVDATPAARGECNPLGTVACMLPWPSSVFLAEDESTVSGFRVDVPPEALPKNAYGVPLDPSLLGRYDGFSPEGVIVVGFPDGVSPDGLPPPDDPAASLAEDSPILLLNAETGERMPFFAEIDQNIEQIDQRALLIRPLVRLAGATRYIVAIRKSVTAPDGSALPLAPAFRALVANETYEHPLMARLAPTYDAIFAALADQGVPRDDLVLAWDYVTASDEFLTSDLRTMRDTALATIEDGAANLTFDAVEIPVGSPSVYRLIQGDFDAPSFLSGPVSDPESVLVRDDGGLPAYQGLDRFHFAALVPACAVNTRPLSVIVFGHGIFGSADEYLSSSLIADVAEDQCVVFVASDWSGFTSNDLAIAADVVQNLNHGPRLTGKLAQSVINFITLVRLVRGPLGASPFLQIDGEPIVDPTRIFYYGASLGGIMGGVFMAYEPDVILGTLGVPGANWSLLFERSLSWSVLGATLQNNYRAKYDYPLAVAFLGMGLDPYDPITTAPGLTEAPMTGVPPKKLFLYETLDDCLVSNYSTEMLVRTMRIPMTLPSVREPWGIWSTEEPVTSGFTIYDEHALPAPPPGNRPPMEDNGTHVDVHRRAAVKRQLGRFFQEGIIDDECYLAESSVACDCATGACD